MKALLQISLGTLGIAMIVPALLRLSVKEETKTLRYTTHTFNFEGATTEGYSSFVISLRNAVKSKKVVFGLPVTATAKEVPNSKRFVLVELKMNDHESITLGIDVTDFYVWGYLDRFEQKERANFFSDAPSFAKDNLFKGATRRSVGFTCNYKDLESKAKTGRGKIPLGVMKLQKAANSVYGKSSVDMKIEAEFFIIAIQMVSEAARFEYILKKVISDGDIYGSYKPGPKTIKLETSWETISTAIQTADAATGTFSKPITLQDEKGHLWVVNNVNDIKNDMGLLKFLKGKKGQASHFSQLTQMAYI